MKNLKINKKKTNDVADKWRRVLKNGGYEHKISNKNECKKIKKLSRFLKYSLKHTTLDISAGNKLKIFEVGCGGAKHLLQFSLNECQSVGLDCSKEVLDRAKNYIKSVSAVCNIKLDINFILRDFLEYNSKEEFDLVFQVGVLEHFLEDKERMMALKNMFDITKPGGWIISAVPNGIHPLRNEMKRDNLGGYNIPEIDYTPEQIHKELEECGGEDIVVLPYNLFLYTLFRKSNYFISLMKKLFYYSFQIIPPSYLPSSFAYRHCGLLMGIAKKPEK